MGTIPTITNNALDLRPAGEREIPVVEEVEALVATDRGSLNAFVSNLNSGVALDEMDEALKKWWVDRY